MSQNALSTLKQTLLFNLILFIFFITFHLMTQHCWPSEMVSAIVWLNGDLTHNSAGMQHEQPDAGRVVIVTVTESRWKMWRKHLNNWIWHVLQTPVGLRVWSRNQNRKGHEKRLLPHRWTSSYKIRTGTSLARCSKLEIPPHLIILQYITLELHVVKKHFNQNVKCAIFQQNHVAWNVLDRSVDYIIK